MRCVQACPCFTQADLLVRSLFAAPDLDYRPPFVIILPSLGLSDELAVKEKAKILFRKPSFAYPQKLLAGWPTGCGGSEFPDPDCSMVDMKSTYALVTGSSMVKERPNMGLFEQGEGILCNRWGCKEKKGPNKDLKDCAKCREVNIAAVSVRYVSLHL